ncbi:MAG: HAD family phosphatase [Ignavibacteriaceae bacterium]
MSNITTLLFDIGGVILTNGWDEVNRIEAAEYFKFDFDETERRHNEIFPEFEKGNISLNKYVEKVIFYKNRNFSREDFIKFIKSRTKPYESSIQILEKLSENGNYLMAAINNESYELNLFRINNFKLYKYFTSFFSSGFLNTRKPEPLIYKIALDVLHKTPDECLFIDDRIENIEEAAKQGIQTIHLTDVKSLHNLLLEKGILLNNK